MIHSGDVSGSGGLRPTHACLGVFQADLTRLIGVLKAFNPNARIPVSIVGPPGISI
jgi:hypothetical protein